MKFLTALYLIILSPFSFANETQENQYLNKPFNLIYDPDESFCAHFENSVLINKNMIKEKFKDFTFRSFSVQRGEENEIFRMGIHYIDNNSKEDIVLVDWIPRSSRSFYLAIYPIFDKGHLYKRKYESRKQLREQTKELRKYLLKNYSFNIHGVGLHPIIPSTFLFKNESGDDFSGDFYGFHEIAVLKLQNKNYFLAKKIIQNLPKIDGEYQIDHMLLFYVDRESHTTYLKCKI